MERQRLKSLLLEAGEGDPAAIDAALRDPQHRSLTAEEALVAAGVVWEDRLAELQATHFAMPVDDLEHVQAEAVSRVPREQALKYTLMPVRLEKGCLTVAMADPDDAVAADAVRYVSGLPVTRVLATRSRIQRAIQQHYESAASSALQAMLQKLLSYEPVETIAFEPMPEAMLETDAEEVEPETIIRLVGSLMVEALRMRASDLHLEPHVDRMRVRYRIDGRLQTVAELPARLHGPCLARLKLISGMDVDERRQPQEGQSKVKIGEASITMTVSTLPTHHGEKIVLRMQDSRKIRVELEALGLLPRDLENLGHMLESSQGLLLITGPGGSGRTSTLYSAFEHCNRPDVNLVSVENPVEYVLAGINQVAVEPEIGLNFPSALRAALRQDPDVLMVSELQDRMTAELALDAAQTGHLVLSTVHGNDTVSVLTRLVKMGLPSHQVAASVSGVLAQRLVRRLCPACRTETPAAPAAVDTVSYMGATMPRVTYQSRGCRACDYLGYRGRIGVFELLTMTDRVRDLIYQERSHREVRAAARMEGMVSLFEDGLEKVELGWTSLEELLRVVVVERPGGRKCGQCGRLMSPEFQVCPYCSDGSTLACPSCHKALEFDWHTCPFCRFALIEPVERELGSGSAVVDLPRLGIVRPVVHVDAPAAVPVNSTPGTDLILLVEDDPIQIEVIRSMLEEEGHYRVVAAVTGEEALNLAHRHHPGLILSDIIMPGMDGLDLLHKLRADIRTALIPVILMTSAADPKGELRAFESGADDYLRKPVEVDRLLARIGAVLRRTGVRV